MLTIDLLCIKFIGRCNYSKMQHCFDQVQKSSTNVEIKGLQADAYYSHLPMITYDYL